MIVKAMLVPGLPQVLLSPEANSGYASLRSAYKKAREEIEAANPDLILYYSTQWLSVLGYTFQADPKPEWVHVDHNFHYLGSMPYQFRCDSTFASTYANEVKKLGYHTMLANYRGFPIDTGTIVAQKLLNPDNKFLASMVSCNMYAEKAETLSLGRAGLKALEAANKKAVVVLVSSLSSRFFIKEVAPKDDHISSAKDDEWNRKICELLGEGRLEDTSQVARDFGREANGDMGFKGMWWLNGICGETNNFTGNLLGYQPIYGTGAAVATFTPKVKVISKAPVEKIQNIVQSETAPEPVGAYPHARREGEFLFLSGVGPRAKGKKEIPGVNIQKDGTIVHDIPTQTRSVIENIKTILESSGSSLNNVVDIQVFLTDMKSQFPAFNKVYEEYFKDIQATRTTIEVGSLPTPIAVEFKVIAKIS